jgi:dihydropyrimidinase
MTAPLDLCIRNGTLVTASERVVADLGVRDGRIMALGRDLPPAATEVDATDLLVLPGGVDAHCHIEEPSYQGAALSDDFASATLAAACGGTTTVISFVNCLPGGGSLRATLEAYQEKARARARIDFAFHLLLGDLPEGRIAQELPALMEDGHLSVKVFMTYDGYRLDDERILSVMDISRRSGGITMVHAENGDCVHWLSDRLAGAGQTRLSAFATSAPPAVEREATHRAIALAEITGARALLVHVSAADALEQIRWARNRGLPILAETCPQYLVQTKDDLDAPDWEAARFLCSPPLRTARDAAHLWQGLAGGMLDLVSSDHCAFSLKTKTAGAARGLAPDFRHVPPGLPGLETRLMLLFEEGVNAGRITVEQFVALTASNPAKIYGLYPRKGSLMPGADADILVWDPKATQVIRHSNLHDACDFTPYEGRSVTGMPVMTFSRGDCLWNRGVVSAKPGRGARVPRKAAAP